MKLTKTIISCLVTLGFLTTTTSSWAQEIESLGISCEVRTYDQPITQFSEISKGPWVVLERTFYGAKNTYLLRVEASERYNGLTILQIKNLETGETVIAHGLVPTREIFRLDYKEISILCTHWPYIAG